MLVQKSVISGPGFFGYLKQNVGPKICYLLKQAGKNPRNTTDQVCARIGGVCSRVPGGGTCPLPDLGYQVVRV